MHSKDPNDGASPRTAEWRRTVFVSAFAVALALASGASRAVLSISEPWIRASADGRTADLFMKVTSSEPATMAAVDSFAARRSIIRPAIAPAGAAPELPLPAGTLVELAPGKSKVALTGLTRGLKQGEYVPVTLIVRAADGKTQKIYINAEVRRRSPTEDELDPHGHEGHKH